MKSYLIVSFFVCFSFLLIALGAIAIPTCTLRSSSCNAGEVCLFSVNQQNNSHVGSCSYYNTLVCCTEITSATIRTGSCNAGEGAVLSMYATSNSHVGSKSYYNNIICAKFASNPVVSNIRTSCLSSEACLISVYQNNDAHTGTCSYYNNKVCIQQLFNVTITVSLNNTLPNWNESLMVSGVATRADGSAVDTSGGPNAVSVAINTTTVCTTNTNSSGGYTCNFTAPNAIGGYLANVTLNDTTTSQLWSNSTTFTVKQTFGLPQTTVQAPKNVVCYEEPRVVQNPDGTLTIATVRICVFR